LNQVNNFLKKNAYGAALQKLSPENKPETDQMVGGINPTTFFALPLAWGVIDVSGRMEAA
jgi:hypothetical protein